MPLSSLAATELLTCACGELELSRVSATTTQAAVTPRTHLGFGEGGELLSGQRLHRLDLVVDQLLLRCAAETRSSAARLHNEPRRHDAEAATWHAPSLAAHGATGHRLRRSRVRSRQLKAAAAGCGQQLAPRLPNAGGRRHRRSCRSYARSEAGAQAKAAPRAACPAVSRAPALPLKQRGKGRWSPSCTARSTPASSVESGASRPRAGRPAKVRPSSGCAGRLSAAMDGLSAALLRVRPNRQCALVPWRCAACPCGLRGRIAHVGALRRGAMRLRLPACGQQGCMAALPPLTLTRARRSCPPSRRTFSLSRSRSFRLPSLRRCVA